MNAHTVLMPDGSEMRVSENEEMGEKILAAWNAAPDGADCAIGTARFTRGGTHIATAVMVDIGAVRFLMAGSSARHAARVIEIAAGRDADPEALRYLAQSMRRSTQNADGGGSA